MIPSSPICAPLQSFGEAPGFKVVDKQKNTYPKQIYPWGSGRNEEYANSKETDIGTSSCVGCFAQGASVYGCEDMSGNVLEWTRSIWIEKYPYHEGNERKDLKAGSDIARVFRGSSFKYNSRYARCTFRDHSHPFYKNHFGGFRVVLSPFPAC